MSTTRLTTAAAIVRYLIAQRTVIDDVEVPLFPGVYRDLRPRQRHQPRSRAARGRRRLADVARAERAGHGPGRCRLRQGCEPPPDHGGHVVDRARRAQHGHRCGRRPRQPFAGAVPGRRHVRQPPARSRSCSRSSTSGIRPITVNDAFKSVSRYWDRIMRPEQIIHSLPHAVAVMLNPADCGPGGAGAAARCAGRGLRLPRRVLRHDDPSHSPPARRPRPTGACRRRVEGRTAAADHRRRGSSLFRSRRRACGVRRGAQRSRRRDGCRPGRACPRPIR